MGKGSDGGGFRVSAECDPIKGPPLLPYEMARASRLPSPPLLSPGFFHACSLLSPASPAECDHGAAAAHVRQPLKGGGGGAGAYSTGSGTASDIYRVWPKQDVLLHSVNESRSLTRALKLRIT